MADPGPVSLRNHAADDLRFIRDTMALAAGFTVVPGWGGALMGVTALVAAWTAGAPGDSGSWLGVWLVDAGVAASIGVGATAWKARRSGVSLAGVSARRFALAFLPSLVAGALLTIVFARAHLIARLPTVWLLTYGAAVTSGGAFSVRPVPLMGVLFMALGVLSVASPERWGHFFMAAGFGALQIGFGIVIARKYGG